MGLIKAALGSTGGILADQWREYFYCDSMDENTLVAAYTQRCTIHKTYSRTLSKQYLF